MISKTSEYALRAVLYLAQESADRPIRASDLARELDVPANYLSKILHRLARAGVLTSERGPRGGFRLAHAAAAISLVRVIETFDPEINRSNCLLGRPQCSEAAPCAVHHRWKAAFEPALEFFKETTIADLLEAV